MIDLYFRKIYKKSNNIFKKFPENEVYVNQKFKVCSLSRTFKN